VSRKVTPHLLTSTIANGSVVSGAILPSDLRWLQKFLERTAARARMNPDVERVTMRLTTTEVRRASRLAKLLGWHEQHHAIGRQPAEPITGVPRGTSPT
jgi:hypothetical protein